MDNAAKTEWEGFADRECGEHRTTGSRAWCFACSEWCYPTSPCAGCELPKLRRLVDAARKMDAVNFAPSVPRDLALARIADRTEAVTGLRAALTDLDSYEV